MLELDPRNPDSSPQLAARLAAAVLQLPGAPGKDLRAAETLYLLAIDRGAEPLQASTAVHDTLRREGANCPGEGGDSLVDGELPEHPAVPLSRALQTANRQVEGLARAADRQVDSLSRAVDEARQRADSLAAELDRIRALLSESVAHPDTTLMHP